MKRHFRLQSSDKRHPHDKSVVVAVRADSHTRSVRAALLYFYRCWPWLMTHGAQVVEVAWSENRGEWVGIDGPWYAKNGRDVEESRERNRQYSYA